MKKGYIISTGTELLLGTTADTNSNFLARKLLDIGIKVVGKSIVGDSESSIRNAFETGIKSADIIISTGGLGPTKDDLTKETACSLMGCRMDLVTEELEKIKEFFTRRERIMPESNIKQAMFPPESIILRNDMGTAPGMYLMKNDKLIILLPGPPREMQNMYQQEVEHLLKKQFKLDINKATNRTIKVLGPGESQVEEMLADILQDYNDCSIALLAVEGEIHIRVTAEAKDIDASQVRIDEITKRVTERMGSNVIGFDEQNLTDTLADYMNKSGKTLAIAESCTGGLISKMITDLPGSSNYFWGSIISYSNQAKEKLLNVKEQTLSKYGAVSEKTAREMVSGIIDISGADIGISITGIAGPGGGTTQKPVGLVYIGVAGPGFLKVKEMRFVGDRNAIRTLSAKTALDLLRRNLIPGRNNK